MIDDIILKKVERIIRLPLMMGGSLHAAEISIIHLMDALFLEKEVKESFIHLWMDEVRAVWGDYEKPGALGYFLCIQFSDAVEWQSRANQIYKKLAKKL